MSEIDPVDSTWRAASREQPPTALDDAIRAAARREVGAKPGRLRAAPRWWPLAAAAIVAALAVGLVLIAPPARVTPAIVAANDTPRREVKPDTVKPMASEPRSDADGAAAVPEAQGDAARSRASEPPQEKKATASRQAPRPHMETAREREGAAKQNTDAAASPAARPSPAVSNPPAAAGPRAEPQPFPATPVPAAPGTSEVLPPTGAAAPAPAPAPADAARKLAVPSAAGALSRNGADSTGPAPANEAAAAGKTTARESDRIARERRQVSSPLTPDEWIKRIRGLIAESKNEDAARELIAFRREYKDRSDSLLPSDLRAFKP